MATIFEKIIAGEIPSYKVWEDDHHLAFLDINPRTIGHTLVIPKKPVSYLFAMNDNDHQALWRAAKHVGSILQGKLGCKRVCVGVYGYEVPHVHIHLFPSNSLEEVPIPPVNPQALSLLEQTAAVLSPA